MHTLTGYILRLKRASRVAVIPVSYTRYLPSDARAVRSQRGDDVRAERCLRVGRDQAALRGVLGVHVVYFTWFLLTKSRN